jgi:hypothetical protein
MAFSGCSGLTSVIIGYSVTRIGNYAFSGCSGLTSVTFIGNNITPFSFYSEAFPQGTSPSGNNLRTAYLADGAGIYTRAISGSVWTKQ